MKKQLLTTTFLMTLASTAAFAHHPAADIVDPEIYAMIDANVSDTHAEMVLDDMGSAAMDDVSAVTDDAVASGAGRFEGRADIDTAMESVASVDTIGLLDDVTGALSE